MARGGEAAYSQLAVHGGDADPQAAMSLGIAIDAAAAAKIAVLYSSKGVIIALMDLLAAEEAVHTDASKALVRMAADLGAAAALAAAAGGGGFTIDGRADGEGAGSRNLGRSRPLGGGAPRR